MYRHRSPSLSVRLGFLSLPYPDGVRPRDLPDGLWEMQQIARTGNAGAGGDHWEPKNGKGPSDDKAAGGRATDARTAGGVDMRGHSKKELYDRAKKLDVRGRSKMSKLELAQAIARKQD
jgi:hypothetical protein